MTRRRCLVLATLAALLAGCSGGGSPGPADLDAIPVEPAAEVVVAGAGIEPSRAQVAPDELVAVRVGAADPVRCVAVNGDEALRTGWQDPGSTVVLRLRTPGIYALTCEGGGEERSGELVVVPDG